MPDLLAEQLADLEQHDLGHGLLGWDQETDLAALLADLTDGTEADDQLLDHQEIEADSELVPEQWGVLVECKSEAEQVRIIGILDKEGVTCNALIS